MLEQKIFKVAQINFAARTILEANFTNILIEGEISNLSTPNSGHIYFSLKDELAQVRAVMFRSRNMSLSFRPKNGDHVVVTANVSLYEPRGDYQLIVEHMEIAGAGALHAKFVQLKAKLEAENLFNVAHKKQLPQIPQCIGVITSPTGAAIRDILNILKRRFPSTSVIIYPTQVQGNEAAAQIVAALQIANIRAECDVLILARGGGSIEDLWPFNEEAVARAIFASTIPIISAIGHETDFTIADFVADIRASTPSAAAELAVPDVTNLLDILYGFLWTLRNALQNKLQYYKLTLENLQNRLRHPLYYLTQQSQRLDEAERRLYLVMQHQLTTWHHHLAKAAFSLDLVSPLATIARGYAIVSKNEKIVRRLADVTVGDIVQTKLSDGTLQCLVKNMGE